VVKGTFLRMYSEVIASVYGESPFTTDHYLRATLAAGATVGREHGVRPEPRRDGPCPMGALWAHRDALLPSAAELRFRHYKTHFRFGAAGGGSLSPDR
jgi:hypothetical protein